jgi:hypothetical protein
MPYCPLCRSEYRPEVTRCADCDVDLAAERPTAQHPDDGWVEVFRGTAVQADIAVSRLDAQDIETLTPDEYTATLGWYAPNMSHAIRDSRTRRRRSSPSLRPRRSRDPLTSLLTAGPSLH